MRRAAKPVLPRGADEGITEAIAKPVAARPERSEGHAQIQKIILDKFKQGKGMNDGI